MTDFTPRTKELLSDLNVHSKRSRFIFVALFVLAALSLVMIVNEKMPWGTKGRVSVRLHNQISDVLRARKREEPKPSPCPTASPEASPTLTPRGRRGAAGPIAGGLTATPLPCSTAAAMIDRKSGGPRLRVSKKGTIPEILSEATMDREAIEEEFLRRLDLSSLETAHIPLIGLEIAATYSGLFAAVAGCLLYAWLIIAVRKEVSVLSHLLYPLVAEMDDDEAQALWGNSNGDLSALRTSIERYHDDARVVREIASASFLTINSRYRRDWAEKASLVLIALPMLVVSIHAVTDIHWDLFRSFSANGGRSVHQEFADHIKVLCESLVLPDKLSGTKAETWVQHCIDHPVHAIRGNPDLIEGADEAIPYISDLRRHLTGLWGIRVSQGVLCLLLLVIGYFAITVILRGSKLLTLAYCTDKRVEEFRAMLKRHLDVPIDK